MQFEKFQATGNDFILLDGRIDSFPALSKEEIAHLCHRRFGIGADGLIILQPSGIADFHMKYYNSDGRESTMCGNGGRCISAWAYYLGLGDDGQLRFTAIDGMHTANVTETDAQQYNVALGMIDVTGYRIIDGDIEIQTGSPHYIRFTDHTDIGDFVEQARAVRNNDTYRAEGINVNFVQMNNGYIRMRTYERGVEDETWSCGTGVVAASLATAIRAGWDSPVKVHTKGGHLEVSFEKEGDSFHKVVLKGPATHVFTGEF